MGKLKFDKTYIYERENGVTYAREFGARPEERQEVGWDYDPRTPDGRPLHAHILEDKLWKNIRRAAETNPALHDALERAKLLYYLSIEDGSKT